MENRREFLKKLFPRLLLVGGALSPLRASLARADAGDLDLSDPRYAALIKELVTRHKFSEEALRADFKKVILRPEIIDKFERPPEKTLPYYEYRRRFINDNVISLGVDYLKTNLPLFQRVEESYGVEKEVICGILGVESRFGQKGLLRYRVFDALNTAFFRYPRREGFFRSELIEFLLLCREEKVDPFEFMGSYAGAFGVPQFMPSSFRRFAVDFDGDGKRDLADSTGDILASVANYLRNFRWRYKGLVKLPATAEKETLQVKQVLGGGLRSTTPVHSLLTMGIKIDPTPDKNEEASLVLYEPREGGGERLLAVFENFRVISRYNFSTNYVLAVTELAEQINKGVSG